MNVKDNTVLVIAINKTCIL